MSQFIVKFLLLGLFYTITAQAYEQLIITKTSNQANLEAINRELSRINVKMYVQKKGNYYVVYSQKFATSKGAKEILQRVKKSFPYARVIEQSDAESKKSSDEKSFFLGVAGGYASSSGSDTTSSGVSYMLEAGYAFNKNIFLSLVYLDSSTSDIDMQSIYTTCNYKYNFTDSLGLYSGVLFGYGTLALTGELQSSSSSSFIFGGQVGVAYNLLEYLALYSAVQYMALDHIIDTSSAQSITFNGTLNAQMGIRFKF